MAERMMRSMGLTSALGRLVITGMLGFAVASAAGCDNKKKGIELCDRAKSECIQSCIAAGSNSSDTQDPCFAACRKNYDTCIETVRK